MSKLLHSLNHHIFIFVIIIKQLSGSQEGMESATIGDKAKWWWLQLGNLSLCLLGLEVDQKEQVTAKDKWSVIDWIHCRLLVFCVTSVEELRSVAKPMPLRSCEGQELKRVLGSPKKFCFLLLLVILAVQLGFTKWPLFICFKNSLIIINEQNFAQEKCSWLLSDLGLITELQM